jgi:hypothetical protein
MGFCNISFTTLITASFASRLGFKPTLLGDSDLLRYERVLLGE